MKLWILKAENDKWRSENTEFKESMLHTEYIAKKKNLILNGIKDHSKNRVKMEKIVKDLSNLCIERIHTLIIQ